MTIFKVSIPNGDRHYLELSRGRAGECFEVVSIPNGDRHYLEPVAAIR